MIYNKIYKNNSSMLTEIIILLLGGFVGFYVIKGVSHALHAPLMSVTNAISSVVILGSIYAFQLCISHSNYSVFVIILSSLAIFIASINIGGGFTISKRMLNMFKKKL